LSFSDVQIVTILADMDAVLPVVEICRKQGISQTLYYPLKEQIIGIPLNELKPIRGIERALMPLYHHQSVRP